MKNLLLIGSLIFLTHCSTGDNISTVRVPPANGTSDTTLAQKIRELESHEYSKSDSSSVTASIQEPVSEPEIISNPEPVDSAVTSIEIAVTPNMPVLVGEVKTPPKEVVRVNPPASTPIAPPVKEPISNPKKKVVEKKAFDYRHLNRDSHRTGEKLTFDINYLAITAGEAVMSVPEEFIYNGRIVQKVLFEARSSRSYSWIYKVQDRYESLLDKYGIYPWKFNKEINEGSFHTTESVVFDHVKEIAVDDENREIKIPPYTHDIISAFYYVRNQDLANMKPGDVFKLSNYSSGKIHPLDVRFVGWEKVTVPAGTFNCVVLEPLVKAGGLFKDEGTLFVWLTNDQLKIPVKVATKVVIGSINVELTKIEGVNRPIPAKIK